MSITKNAFDDQTGLLRTLAVLILLSLLFVSTSAHMLVSSFGYERSPQHPRKGVKTVDEFGKEVLAFQGIWTVDGEVGGPMMARMVVHADYFLLIYQWSKKDTRAIEIKGFKADSGKIYGKDGENVLTYHITGPKTLHLDLEVDDESPDRASRHKEIKLKRIGLLPDLILKAAE